MEDQVIAKMADEVAEWGYPIGSFEIKFMVKDLLDSKNIKNSPFPNNVLGDNWFANFCKGNKMTKHLASNIKICRSAINEEIVNNFDKQISSMTLAMGNCQKG